MSAWPELDRQLERHEGRRRKPYVDTTGNITVGIGRNLTGAGLSDDEINYLRDNDILAVVTDLQTFGWFTGLNEPRRRAVADFRFNVGPATFRRFPRFMHAMAIGDYEAAARELAASIWAKQVGMRSSDLETMLRTGEDHLL